MESKQKKAAGKHEEENNPSANKKLPLAAQIFIALVIAIIAGLLFQGQADFANAERHKAAMLKAENPLEYDYSDGWTANYEQAAAELEEVEK